MSQAGGHDTFDEFPLVSRSLSALFDLLTILLVFLIARRLLGEPTALVAALLLTLTPLHIQLAHVGTFDTFAAANCLAVFWFALKAHERGRWWDFALSGVAAGLAIGSRLDTLPILLLVRQTRQLIAKGARPAEVAPTVAAMMAIIPAWSLGEAIGYCQSVLPQGRAKPN